MHRISFNSITRKKTDWVIFKKALVNYFGGESIRKGLEEVDPELLRITLDRYLALYSLINWGWNDIQLFFKGVEIPSRPGDAFIFILEEKVIPQDVNSKTKLSRFTKKIKKTNPETYLDCLVFLNACLEACGKSKSRVVRRKLQEYYQKSLNWEAFLVNYMEPSIETLTLATPDTLSNK